MEDPEDGVEHLAIVLARTPTTLLRRKEVLDRGPLPVVQLVPMQGSLPGTQEKAPERSIGTETDYSDGL